MLSESKAWLEAARIADWQSSGLCCVIDNLHDDDIISTTTYRRMMARVEKLAKRKCDDDSYLIYHFLWPLNQAGFRARVAWARRQSILSRAKAGKRVGG